MPIKKQTAGRFVEVSLKIAKTKFPLISEALKAVLALAGNQARLEPKTPPAAAPARPGRRRRTAGGPETAPSETAALIRDLRIKAGLSQKALADKAGISQNHISLLETGKQHPSPALAKKLGRLLKTPITAKN